MGGYVTSGPTEALSQGRLAAEGSGAAQRTKPLPKFNLKKNFCFWVVFLEAKISV